MKLTHRSSKNQHRSTSDLGELMATAPMTAEDYSAMMRKRVEMRRMIEDALEEARMRQNSLMES